MRVLQSTESDIRVKGSLAPARSRAAMLSQTATGGVTSTRYGSVLVQITKYSHVSASGNSISQPQIHTTKRTCSSCYFLLTINGSTMNRSRGIHLRTLTSGPDHMSC
jgi:hypothetical protein